MTTTDERFPEVPNFDFEELIGEGASGRVYRGRQRSMGRLAAGKVIPLIDHDDPQTTEERFRLRQEANILANLKHENILGVYDYGETATHAYLIEELINGETLKAKLDARHAFTLAEVRWIMRGIANGLAATHECGIVHRDLKPGNVMLCHRDGRVVIIDYGIARNRNSTWTRVGTTLGTPLYVSPEQWAGQAVDGRADVYSASAMLYHLMTAQRPYLGSAEQVIFRMLSEDPRPPSEVAPHVPRAFDAVIKCGMAKNRDYRYSTIREFEAAVERAFGAGEMQPDDTVSPRAAAEARAQAPPAPRVRRQAPAIRARPRKLKRWRRLLQRLLAAG